MAITPLAKAAAEAITKKRKRKPRSRPGVESQIREFLDVLIAADLADTETGDDVTALDPQGSRAIATWKHYAAETGNEFVLNGFKQFRYVTIVRVWTATVKRLYAAKGCAAQWAKLRNAKDWGREV